MNRQAINTDKQSNNWVQNILSDRKRTLDAVTVIAAIIFVIILSIAVPNFLTINNIVNVLEQLTTIGMLCLGMTFILIIGGIGLSMPAVLMELFSE